MLWMDLRYAVRSLRTNRSFTLAAILARGLGIGATTAIFSIVDLVLLRPLPFPEPDRLVSVATTLPGLRSTGIVSAEFLDWNDHNQVFESFAAMNLFPSDAALITPAGPVQIRMTHVSAKFLSTLRVSPMLGRDFLENESGILLSYGLWQDKFHADRSALGKSVTLDGAPFVVTGVLPRNFFFPQNIRIDALTPFQIDMAKTRSRIALSVWDSIARLKPGVSIDQARANLATLFAASRAADSVMYHSDARLDVIPYRDRLTGDVRLTLWILLAAVGCVLLIACSNVANLLLARATGRRREIAVRSALGASRARLIRQLLTESVLLSILGGVGGVSIAAATAALLKRIAPEDLPRIGELSIDVRVLGFALIVSLMTGVAFGLAPALSATRMAVRFVRSGPRGTLIALEIALSLILLAGAGLLFQSLYRLQHRHLGFEPENIFTSDVSIRGARLNDLRDRITGFPGARSVAFADSLPPNGGSSMVTFSREGRPLPEPGHRGDNMIRRRVSATYFEALRIPLKRGRLFTAADHDDVAIVSESLARHYFPGEDPIGKKIDTLPIFHPAKTIIGIVADVKNQGLDREPMPEMYGPLHGDERRVYVIVRSVGDPVLTASTLRDQLRAMDPAMPAAIQTMEQQFAAMTTRPRFNGILFGSFGAVALLLAIVGVYGVISFTVARRMQEIGIRVALGADRARIARLILREAMIPAVAGIALGVAAAIFAGRYLASLLYDIQPADPATLIVVSFVLAIIAAAASLFPALRAARIDPMRVLQSE